MVNNKRLNTSLKKFNKKKDDVITLISGELGIPLNGSKTVEVPNRKGYVFVRLKGNTSELIQAYNAVVSPVYDLPVLVSRQGNRYIIVGRNVERYSNQWSLAPYLPKHGAQHSFNPDINIGGDVVWVYSPQFMPLLGYPSGTAGSPRLTISPYTIRDVNGNWKYVGNTGTPDTTPYNPTTGSRAVMGLVYLDTVSGNPYLLINSGTYMDSSLTGSNQIVDYIPKVTNPNWLPIAGIRLLSGTTQLSWNNTYDVRPFLQVIPTGTGGGGSFTWNIQDEGVPLGTATTLNVVGVNADISISGSVARLFITGSTGGGTVNPPVTGSIVIQDEGRTLGSVLVLNAGANLTASISGSVGLLDANLILEHTDDFTSQIDGTGTTFGATTVVPVAPTAHLYYNGVRQRYTFDYSISGSYVQTNFIPTTGSVLLLDYNESTSTGTPNGLIQIQDEGIPKGNVSGLNFVGAGVSATVSGTFATVTVVGSAAVPVKTYWSPDAPPTSPTSQNDEFDDGSLDGKWSEFDPNNLLTVTESSTYKSLILTQSTRAGDNITGIYQTIPAGDFTIWTRVSTMGQRLNYQLAGLCLWENPSDVTKSMMLTTLTFNASNIMWEILKMNNHNSFNSAPYSTAANYQPHAYLRVRRNGTNYYHAWSLDGMGWYEYATATNPLATPTKFGLFLNNNNSGVSFSSIFSCFRYVASDVGFTGVLAGQPIGMYT